MKNFIRGKQLGTGEAAIRTNANNCNKTIQQQTVRRICTMPHKTPKAKIVW